MATGSSIFPCPSSLTAGSSTSLPTPQLSLCTLCGLLPGTCQPCKSRPQAPLLIPPPRAPTLQSIPLCTQVADMLALDKPRTAPPGWWTPPPPFPAGHSLATKPRSKAAASSKKSATVARWASLSRGLRQDRMLHPRMWELGSGLGVKLLGLPLVVRDCSTAPLTMRARWLPKPGPPRSKPRPCCAGMAWRPRPLRSPGWLWSPSQLPGLQCSHCHWRCQGLSLPSLVSFKPGHLPPLPR